MLRGCSRTLKTPNSPPLRIVELGLNRSRYYGKLGATDVKKNGKATINWCDGVTVFN